MTIEFRWKLSRILIFMGILWTAVAFTQACSSIDGVFTVLEAAIAAIGPILTLVGTLLNPGEAAIVTTAVGGLSNVIVALKTAVDAYLADTSDVTLLSKVQEALTVAQAAIPTFLAAVNLGNPVITTWVTAIVNAVNGVFVAVASDILKPATEALTVTGSLKPEVVGLMKQKSNSIMTTFVASVDAATASSKLPDYAKSQYHKEFHKHVSRHIGPITI